MRLALIADTFPPLRTSGAVQLRDLSRELVRQGHDLTILLPDADLDGYWREQDFEGAQVLRLRAPKTKDIGYLRRTLGEFRMPFAMLRSLRRSPFAQRRFDGIIWYSPSIFHGPLVSALKRTSGCASYLIIRDIFPEWALDMGLMKRGPVYGFFDAIARYQYSVANVIAVQSPGNLRYFEKWKRTPGRELEVLPNWLGKPAHIPCSIRIDKTPLAGRKIIVYAGNIGVAQGLDIILDLAARMESRKDIGFVFVGRGSEAPKLKQRAGRLGLSNIVFFDEIDPDEVPDLYHQCSVGIVSLDHRHRSHNIPGKFLTYMQSGLPVLANINSGNDLAELIETHRVGKSSDKNDAADLERKLLEIIENTDDDDAWKERCQTLFESEFSVRSAADQVTSSLGALRFKASSQESGSQ